MRLSKNPFPLRRPVMGIVAAKWPELGRKNFGRRSAKSGVKFLNMGGGVLADQRLISLEYCYQNSDSIRAGSWSPVTRSFAGEPTTRPADAMVAWRVAGGSCGKERSWKARLSFFLGWGTETAVVAGTRWSRAHDSLCIYRAKVSSDLGKKQKWRS